MSEHKDIHGDNIIISKAESGLVWIECNESDASVTELCFNREVVRKIIKDLQEQIEEKRDAPDNKW